jgi:hypothetical protein
MAYQKGGRIDAVDINLLIANVNSVLNDLGQTPLSNVSQYGKITYSEWKNVVDKLGNLGNQQGTVLTSITSPKSGDATSYLAAILTNRDNVINPSNKYNAAAQGTVLYYGTEVTASWSDYVTFTQSITFATGAAATNYFNAGGQLALQFVHPASTTGIDGLFNGLATNCGTVVMSGQNTGTRKIAGQVYNGITKIPPSLPAPGNSPTIGTNLGYAGLTTNSTEIFKQIGATYVNPAAGGGKYSLCNITVSASISNGGATVNFVTTWDEIPNNLVTGAASYIGPAQGGVGSAVTRTRTTTYVVVRPPSETYISKSWGTLVFAGSAIGV